MRPPLRKASADLSAVRARPSAAPSTGPQGRALLLVHQAGRSRPRPSCRGRTTSGSYSPFPCPILRARDAAPWMGGRTMPFRARYACAGSPLSKALRKRGFESRAGVPHAARDRDLKLVGREGVVPTVESDPFGEKADPRSRRAPERTPRPRRDRRRRRGGGGRRATGGRGHRTRRR